MTEHMPLYATAQAGLSAADHHHDGSRKISVRVARSLTDIMQIVAIRASVGVGLYPDDGVSPGDLVRSADAAMYRAKQRRLELEPA